MALHRDYTVIIDSTNLNPKTIEKWKNISRELKADMEIKTFYIPFNEAVIRDMNEDRSHHVGIEVLKHFYSKYYPEQYKKEIEGE